MKTKIGIAIALFFTTFTLHAAPYDLQVTVGYNFGVVSSSGTYFASPDTGFVTIRNVGTAAYTGSFTLQGAAGFGGNVLDTSGLNYTLASGSSWTLLAGFEGSNQGGFNGPFGTMQLGLELLIAGMWQGGPSSLTDLFDSQIHSGVFRTNPFGVTLDNYILQGGDPFGRDTGDGFEVEQAYAVFDITGSVPTPESGGTWMLLSSALLVIVILRRKLTA
jgi:hypothetical protein